MKIFICVKHVPDSAAKITIQGNNQFDESITFILNPYDEHAVEEAARVKKQIGDCEVIAVSVGKKDAENTLRSALAMGADRAILIQTDDRPDSIVTARALKAAIEQDGKPGLIPNDVPACGRPGYAGCIQCGGFCIGSGSGCGGM